MCISLPPGVATATDTELILGVARKDRAAFVELFGRYAGRIKAFALRGGASEADADEIAQDVMVAIWRRAESFDPNRAGVSTWIFSIARNRRIDMLRRLGRPKPDPEDPVLQPGAEPDGIDIVTASEREARVRVALDRLPPNQRDIVVAAFYDGLTHSEIADRFAIPLGTVKSRLRLGFRHLRDALGEDLAAGLVND